MALSAAILCPGPSLARLPDLDCGLVVAVNRAVHRRQCHWWCFIDWQTYLENREVRPHQICTSRASLREIERRAGKPSGQIQIIDDMPEGDNGWRLYTKTTAMILCYRLGAGTIDVYGDDMAGVADYDGTTSQRNTRDGERWKREAELTGATVQYLHTKGCEVRRIQT